MFVSLCLQVCVCLYHFVCRFTGVSNAIKVLIEATIVFASSLVGIHWTLTHVADSPLVPLRCTSNLGLLMHLCLCLWRENERERKSDDTHSIFYLVATSWTPSLCLFGFSLSTHARDREKRVGEEEKERKDKEIERIRQREGGVENEKKRLKPGKRPREETQRKQNNERKIKRRRER